MCRGGTIDGARASFSFGLAGPLAYNECSLTEIESPADERSEDVNSIALTGMLTKISDKHEGAAS